MHPQEWLRRLVENLKVHVKQYQGEIGLEKETLGPEAIEDYLNRSIFESGASEKLNGAINLQNHQQDLIE